MFILPLHHDHSSVTSTKSRNFAVYGMFLPITNFVTPQVVYLNWPLSLSSSNSTCSFCSAPSLFFYHFYIIKKLQFNGQFEIEIEIISMFNVQQFSHNTTNWPLPPTIWTPAPLTPTIWTRMPFPPAIWTPLLPPSLMTPTNARNVTVKIDFLLNIFTHLL